MTGDNRSRHCAQCNLNVYNFSEMTAAEIEQLIAASAGQRLCGRLYQRPDGTILTRDCPVGLRARIRRVSPRLTAALAAAISLVFATQACSWQTSPLQGQLLPPTPQQTTPQPGTAVMGDIVPPVITGFNLTVVASGAPVPQALVTVLDRKTGKSIAQGTTNQAGAFSLTPVAAGDYEILVQTKEYTRGTAFISVKPHQMQNLTVGLHTAADEARAFTTGIVAMTAVANPSRK
ncbi:MAG TPA: carboxypeptidase-like regulatory domain-containing protein [Candidatus Sulfotelmatobacter sp.]